ncbi:MCP four helix bundle domain-containing protein [Pelomonas sp. V22]|uniref:methyl-accepting chemotaxis protein n=1 Tax=Pelomonas sp. V22 TaxID=2822139 RepID=UPI0024A92AAA|nr:methyl-accepting chemotaxis protein [Pelomonas sp. V22]MDI4632222.1 MCP four helix bundle domain-containing protein [Pelomonas sp. V22]
MPSLKNISIARKLTAAFVIMLALLAGLAWFANSRLRVVQDDSRQISSVWLPAVRLAGVIDASASDFRIGLLQMMAATTPEQTKIAEGNMAKAQEELRTAQADYRPLISTDEERRLFDRFSAEWARYQQLAGTAAAAVRAGNVDEGRKIQGGEARQAYLAASKLLQDLVDLNAKGAEASADHSETAFKSAQLWLIVVSALAATAAIAMAITLVRAITAPLARAVQVADQVADGDLSQRIAFEGSDETARLLAALQRMQQALAGTVGTVRQGAESVAAASAQIAQGNVDLSARTEEQASSLEQTSATMEQLSATVRQNADSAQQANQLAQSASQVARDGGAVVGEVVSTMRGIEDSSKRIADIIGTIDGIAFQTNILALNAAVEAARAGEQGRGFAVVAGEVRTLAQRSAEAAKEIKTLIGDSVERVQTGTQLVDRAGKTMGDIVSSVQRVADIVGEISSASSEQSSGIAQIGEAVTQLDHATQQNAALVEESTAASESLKAQAARLLESVASFRLANGAPALRLARVATPARQRDPSLSAADNSWAGY